MMTPRTPSPNQSPRPLSCGLVGHVHSAATWMMPSMMPSTERMNCVAAVMPSPLSFLLRHPCSAMPRPQCLLRNASSMLPLPGRH